jgi:hypothetical protein
MAIPHLSPPFTNPRGSSKVISKLYLLLLDVEIPLFTQDAHVGQIIGQPDILDQTAGKPESCQGQ